MKQFIALITFISLTGCFGIEPQKTGKEGKPLPELSLLLADSTTWLHNKDIPVGKPFVLFYMSPFCPYCKAQTEQIIDNIDNLKDIHFYLITAYPLSTMKSFINDHQLNKYPNITCGIDSSNALANYFEISGIPYLAIYGKNKTLNKSFLGKMYTSQIRKVANE